MVDGSWSVSGGVFSGASSSHHGPDLVIDPGMDAGVTDFTVTYTIAGDTSFGIVPACSSGSSYCQLCWWAGSTLYTATSSGGEQGQGGHAWTYGRYSTVEAVVDIPGATVDVYEDGSLLWSGDPGCSAFTWTGELGIGLHQSATMYLDAIEVEWEYVDNDGDGYDEDDGDCDDADAAVGPGAPETWCDGVDSDCDGGSDFDADGDGFLAADYGGGDCDDGDAAVNPAAGEAWYDGVDQDCDGNDDDQDADGHPAEVAGGDDCDDTDASRHPGAEDLVDDGIDQDCDGADETTPEAVDTGDDPALDGDKGDFEGGCACSAGGTPAGGLAWLGLLGLVGLARRRRG